MPALRDVVRIKFGVERASDSSYQLLLKFCGMSFKLPDTFDKRRDEAAITARMTQIRQEVAELLTRGWEVRTVDEVRVEHEAETRRMWLPRGRRTRLHVDRTRSARSFFGALSLTTKKMKIHPIEGNQNAEQITLAMTRLARETENEKIAVVLDDAGFHHAKAVTDPYEPGQALERIKPIHLPPCTPTTTPRSTSGTPPRPTSQTSRRTPPNRPTRPSPNTSPAAPSTTTSNTYQSHHPKETSFNASHTATGEPASPAPEAASATARQWVESRTRVNAHVRLPRAAGANPPANTRTGRRRPTLHPRADPARGSCCTAFAFVTGPVLPPHRRLDHQQPHGAPTTRPAPRRRRLSRPDPPRCPAGGGRSTSPDRPSPAPPSEPFPRGPR